MWFIISFLLLCTHTHNSFTMQEQCYLATMPTDIQKEILSYIFTGPNKDSALNIATDAKTESSLNKTLTHIGLLSHADDIETTYLLHNIQHPKMDLKKLHVHDGFAIAFGKVNTSKKETIVDYLYEKKYSSPLWKEVKKEHQNCMQKIHGLREIVEKNKPSLFQEMFGEYIHGKAQNDAKYKEYRRLLENNDSLYDKNVQQLLASIQTWCTQDPAATLYAALQQEKKVEDLKYPYMLQNYRLQAIYHLPQEFAIKNMWGFHDISKTAFGYTELPLILMFPSCNIHTKNISKIIFKNHIKKISATDINALKQCDPTNITLIFDTGVNFKNSFVSPELLTLKNKTFVFPVMPTSIKNNTALQHDQYPKSLYHWYKNQDLHYIPKPLWMRRSITNLACSTLACYVFKKLCFDQTKSTFANHVNIIEQAKINSFNNTIHPLLTSPIINALQVKAHNKQLPQLLNQIIPPLTHNVSVNAETLTRADAIIAKTNKIQKHADTQIGQRDPSIKLGLFSILFAGGILYNIKNSFMSLFSYFFKPDWLPYYIPMQLRIVTSKENNG